MKNINYSLISTVPTKQRRFYILIAALIFSNFAVKSGYGLSGYCDTDTTRTCYTCNPATPGTLDASKWDDIIDGACSDHNDGEVWCQTREEYSGGDIIYHSGSNYKCTQDGWQYTTETPGSGGGGDTPISCTAGYYLHETSGQCKRCPSAEFYWAEPEEDYYIQGSNVSATSNAGATDIYSCYISSGTGSYKNEYMDDTGVFTFVQNCYYGS